VGRGRVVALGIAGVCVGIPAVVAVIVVALTLSGVTQAYRVSTAAMAPTLRSSGDHVFSVRYLFSHPGRSDIVAFHAPARAASLCGKSGVFVQRIVGLPGEKWQEQKGRVYIDDQLLVEPYIEAAGRDHLTRSPVEIPAGMYFLMGDNRRASCDSRDWGPIPRRSIIGRVIATYWPPSRIALH
jgi:signal peptidase I